jgi:hypothetical protein
MYSHPQGDLFFMTRIEIVGVYKIVPTIQSIQKAARYHHCDFMLDEQGEYVEPISWNDLENLALVELRIRGKFWPAVLSSIRQGDQAAYLEFYLDNTGARISDEDEAIESDDRRVCFFLHRIDATKPLIIDQSDIRMPPMSELPKRLEPYAHYLPVS